MIAGTHADTLLLDAITAAPPNSAEGVLRPRSGQSMDSVKSSFGEPTSMTEAVGEPPITRWIYPAYTVYFEHQHVIEVVVHR
jgi:hypothetical protein